MSQKLKVAYLLSEENEKRIESLDSDKFLVHGNINAESDVYFIDTHQDEDKIISLVEERGNRVYLINHLGVEEVIIGIISKCQINHIIGETSQVFEREIISHLNHRMNDLVPSIETILEEGSNIIHQEIRDSKTIDQVIDHMVEKITIGPFFDSPIEYLKIFGNELLVNAFFSTEHNEKSRTIKLILDVDVHAKLGVDDHCLVFSVKDPYGSLKRERLIEALLRSCREKTPIEQEGGAGLGLYMTLMNSNQVFINVNNKKSTEVICVIDRTKRMKNFKSRITSFNFYEGA